jgi:hypothetical protein
MIFYNTRTDLLTLIRNGSKICEIGVFKGDFSKSILQICKPTKLLLIDPWEGQITSGDLNGNNVEVFNGDLIYSQVYESFSRDPRVELLKSKSNSLQNYANDSFDCVYIDGDHSYDGVKADLEMSLRVVRDGGFIMGHDYLINPEKTKNNYDFGVKRAVDEFCLAHTQQIYALAMDGCVSFCIHVNKTDQS